MKKLCMKLYMVLILIFLYAPIAVLIVFSFNSAKSQTRWEGFSLRWYEKLFSDPNIMQALYYTIIIGILASLIATVIGTLAAIGIHSFRRKPQKLTLTVNNIPVMSPDIVTGVSFMVLYVTIFNLLGIGNLGFMTLLLSHIAICVPYIVLSIMPKLQQLDKNLFEAALDLGAKPLYALWHIILPEIFPGIITGALIAFTLSIDDFVVSFFTTGVGISNLSIEIYSMSRRGINPEINALSTIMFVSVFILLFLISKRDSKQLEET